MKKTKEGDVLKACLDYLELRGIFAWRNNSGAVVSSYTRKGDGKTKSRFIRYGYPGSGDIIGLLPHGRFLSIEVKKPGSRTEPKRKEAQEAFAARIRASGGLALRVDSLDLLIESLGEINSLSP